MALVTGCFIVGLVVAKAHPEWLGGLAQSDRIATWAEPHLHPHNGDQLRRAITAIIQGGWLGRQWVESFNAHGVMGIPALQDDFAPAFLINRLGIAGALLLLFMQLLLLFTLAAMGHALLRLRSRWQSGDRYRRHTFWFAYFYLYGAAAFLAAHFIVSWGTNSGLLPVMGQPMPFVSAAGSTWYFFFSPCLSVV